jgi:transposase
VLLTAARNGKSLIRNRAIAMLAYFRGISSAHISSFLKISRRTVFLFAKDFRNGGTKELLTRKPRKDKKVNNESIKSAVFSLLHSPPAEHGINRTTWRLDDLRRILKEEFNTLINRASISMIIKGAGWTWRHARVVLTSNDPEYRTKLESIKKILSQLEPNEAFFSIDEYGPFAIKRRGGVKRVGPGDQYVIPQWQKSKGWLILTAAIELSRNRVTHFFSRKKNTAEMIKMADLLRDKYRGLKTLYFSWDAASWHISKELAAHLDSLNEKAEEEGFPLIKMATLPTGAQFYNVIESVFSGMARAIIHNSDYPSPGAAIEAIDRYFEQRNEYFATHPKRAGDKIWGMERVPSHFAEDQNCKDPAYQFPY